MVEQATKKYNFEPVLKMVKADKQRLNNRRNQLYQELELKSQDLIMLKKN